KLRMDLIHPYPEQDPEEIRRAQPFLEQLERLLRETVDSDRIDREGEIPDAVIQELCALGAFGIKIPREDGGLRLSQLPDVRARAERQRCRAGGRVSACSVRAGGGRATVTAGWSRRCGAKPIPVEHSRRAYVLTLLTAGCSDSMPPLNACESVDRHLEVARGFV